MDIGLVDLQWLQVPSEGLTYSLEKFMSKQDVLHVIHFNTLEHECTVMNQIIPIVLSLNATEKEKLEGSKSVALFHNGELYAKKGEQAAGKFGTAHISHPYIKMVYEVVRTQVGRRFGSVPLHFKLA